jgi:hypothetical protein
MHPEMPGKCQDQATVPATGATPVGAPDEDLKILIFGPRQPA